VTTRGAPAESPNKVQTKLSASGSPELARVRAQWAPPARRRGQVVGRAPGCWRLRACGVVAVSSVFYKINHLVSRLFFRGIDFPPKGTWGWLKLIAQNRSSVFRIIHESFTQWHGTPDAVGRRDLRNQTGQKKFCTSNAGWRIVTAVTPRGQPGNGDPGNPGQGTRQRAPGSKSFDLRIGNKGGHPNQSGQG
jgi:hypothetical protein